MNIETLQLINRNQTSKTIFQLLANSTPISNQTNIESFKVFLKKRGFDVIDEDFYKVFDDLEEIGVGYFSQLQPDKFMWKYNLKDVSEQIVYPNKKVDIRAEGPIELEDREPRRVIVETKKEEKPMKQEVSKRRPGRPPGAKNKSKVTELSKPAALTRRPVVVKEELMSVDKQVIFFFKTRRGRMVPLSLDDANDLIDQVEQVKQELG